MPVAVGCNVGRCGQEIPLNGLVQRKAVGLIEVEQQVGMDGIGRLRKLLAIEFHDAGPLRRRAGHVDQDGVGRKGA